VKSHASTANASKSPARAASVRPARGAIPPALRARLLELANKHGDVATARMLGIALGTLMRAIAGRSIQRATETHLVVNVEALSYAVAGIGARR
jgi:hypothetical protein